MFAAIETRISLNASYVTGCGFSCRSSETSNYYLWPWIQSPSVEYIVRLLYLDC